MKSLKKIICKLTTFDYVLIALVVLGVVFFAFWFFRKPNYIDVTLKINEDDVAYYFPGSRNWFANMFHVGMQEKDGLGRINAEVKSVYYYPVTPNQKSVYITVNLRALYTKATNTYSYNGKPLLIGYPIKLQLDSVSANGIIADLDGVLMNSQKEKLLVDVQLWNDSQNFVDTSGVKPYLASEINVGDTILDNEGNVLVKVIDKKVSDAKQVVSTVSGMAVVSANPLLKDVYLKLEVNAIKIGNKYYIVYDIPIIVGEKLALNFDHLSITPDVTHFEIYK